MVQVKRTDGNKLRIRPDPSMSQAPIGWIGLGKRARVRKVVPNGEAFEGRTRWYKIKKPSGVIGYVSTRFVKCYDPDARPSYGPKKFLLPLKCDSRRTVTQGNSSAFSHNGRSKYAFDFGLPVGTPIKASRKGVVIYRRNSTRPGDVCWSNGPPSCITKANYVVLKHPDGTRTMYAHVNKVTVPIGARVARGQTIAKSGNTGWSSGPHLHFAREQHCSSSHCQTIPMRFGDVGGTGRPTSGQVVKSGNCPQ
jgi:murein DD-endopeptidase MepM/ murein hydrolase activator NlpD